MLFSAASQSGNLEQPRPPCPPSRVGVGGDRPRGHELAPTWLQSSQQGSWGGSKRGGGPVTGLPWEEEARVRGPYPATPTPHPLPDPPHPTAPTASEMACHELGASEAKVPTRVEERCSPPSSSWPEHVPNGSLGPRWVSLLLFSSHILQRGVGAAWAGAKDTADPRKLKPRPNGST